MGGRQAVEEQRLAGGVGAHAVAQDRGDVGLVDGDPVLDAVGEPLADDGGVLREAVDGVAVEPAAVVLERLREVPVVERDHRLLAVLEERVDEPVVERQALLVGRAAAGRLDPRPGDREAVAARAELLHQRDVLVDPVVVVAGDLAAAAVDDPPGLGGEGVPDARARGRPPPPHPRSGSSPCWCRTGNRAGAGGSHAGEAHPRRYRHGSGPVRRFAQVVGDRRGRVTRHSFSFGPHYDPANLGFGPLVCHNDDVLDPSLAPVRATPSTRTPSWRSSPGCSRARWCTPTRRARGTRRRGRPGAGAVGGHRHPAQRGRRPAVGPLPVRPGVARADRRRAPSRRTSWARRRRRRPAWSRWPAAPGCRSARPAPGCWSPGSPPASR